MSPSSGGNAILLGQWLRCKIAVGWPLGRIRVLNAVSAAAVPGLRTRLMDFSCLDFRTSSARLQSVLPSCCSGKWRPGPRICRSSTSRAEASLNFGREDGVTGRRQDRKQSSRAGWPCCHPLTPPPYCSGRCLLAARSTCASRWLANPHGIAHRSAN